MAGWFDEFAKRSARGRAPLTAVADEASGLSRRDVITRGALVAGAAWTAPMLMSTRAYAFGTSACLGPEYVCGSDVTTLQYCCPFPVSGAGATYRCTSDNGVNGCAAPQQPGGICLGNNGSGTSSCIDGVFCNGNASSNDCRCTAPNTCGGYGSTCSSSTAKSCAPGFACSGGFCRPKCVNGNCDSGILNSGDTLTCVGTVCQQVCKTTGGKSTCPNGQSCSTNGFCV